jgi:hypothetical protein
MNRRVNTLTSKFGFAEFFLSCEESLAFFAQRAENFIVIPCRPFDVFGVKGRMKGAIPLS